VKIQPRQIILLASLAGLLIVLMVLFFQAGKERAAVPDVSSPASEPGEESAEETVTRKIDLYFLSEDDPLLHPEEREIPVEEAPIEEARLVLEELLRGSRFDGISAIPPETRLRELFITEQGIAMVDFSREFQDNHPSGAAAEMATVFAVVNTLVRNVEAVKRVVILVDGVEKETLKGHVGLRKALLPRFDLAAGGGR